MLVGAFGILLVVAAGGTSLFILYGVVLLEDVRLLARFR